MRTIENILEEESLNNNNNVYFICTSQQDYDWLMEGLKDYNWNSKWAIENHDNNSDFEANLMHDNVVAELIKKIKE